MIAFIKSIFSDSFQSQIDKLDLEEPKRVPVLDTGIPLHSPEKLILSQEDVLKKIKLISECDKVEFDKFYGSLIYNYAKYVHQLPASENHHHAAVGGLLRHGLEVAAGAFAVSNDRIFDPNATLEKRRVVEPVYRYAVFIAALVHDLGKAAYDIVVHNSDHSSVWDPFVEPLYDWACRNKISHYYLHFSRQRKHKKHELLTTIVVSHVIPQHCLSYMHNADPQILPTMLSAISGLDDPEDNEILNIINMADRNSVRLNLQGALDLEGTSFSGVTLPQHFINTAKLLSKKEFKPNCPGSKVYYSKGEAFLIYPASVQMIINQLEKDGVNGIPRDPDVFLSELAASNVLVTRKDSFGGETPIWNLRFTKRDNSASVKFRCVRLSNPEHMFIAPPARSANIELLNDQDEVIEILSINKSENGNDSHHVEQSAAQKTADNNKTKELSRLDEIIQTLGKASASGIFISSIASDIKNEVPDVMALAIVDRECLCLKYPDCFEHYGIDAVTTSKELLSHKIVDSTTGSEPSAEVQITLANRKISVVRFTNTFTKSICAKEKIAVIKRSTSSSEINQPEPPQQTKADCPVESEGQGRGELEAPKEPKELLSEFILHFRSEDISKLSFPCRIIDGKLIIHRRDSIKRYGKINPNVNLADLERVIEQAHLNEPLPRRIENEFVAAHMVILPIDEPGDSLDGVQTN